MFTFTVYCQYVDTESPRYRGSETTQGCTTCASIVLLCHQNLTHIHHSLKECKMYTQTLQRSFTSAACHL